MSMPKKSVLEVAQGLVGSFLRIKKVIVLMEMEDGTFMSDGNGITVNDARHMVRAFHSAVESNMVKHQADKKLSKKELQKPYVM